MDLQAPHTSTSSQLILKEIENLLNEFELLYCYLLYY